MNASHDWIETPDITTWLKPSFMFGLIMRVHHDLGYPVHFAKGGTAHVTGSRSSHPYDEDVRCDERDWG